MTDIPDADRWNTNIHYHGILADAVAAADSVLDVGCGEGMLSRRLRQRIPHVTGIDLHEPSIELARPRVRRISPICARTSWPTRSSRNPSTASSRWRPCTIWIRRRHCRVWPNYSGPEELWRSSGWRCRTGPPISRASSPRVSATTGTASPGSAGSTPHPLCGRRRTPTPIFVSCPEGSPAPPTGGISTGATRSCGPRSSAVQGVSVSSPAARQELRSAVKASAWVARKDSMESALSLRNRR